MMKAAVTPAARLLKKLTQRQAIEIANKKCQHGHSYLSHVNCALQDLGIEERIGVIDIEATDVMSAHYGYCLCWCLKEMGGEIIEACIRPSEVRSREKRDRRIIEKAIDAMRGFDRLVVYWGKPRRYDLPFLRTRALIHGLDFPVAGEIYVTDLYDTVRNKMKLRYNRLAIACDALGIESKGHPIIPAVWQDAAAGKKEALDYILQHCREDVISTEALYNRLEGHFNLTRASI